MRTATKQHMQRIAADIFRMSHYLAFGLALYFLVFDKAIGLQESNPGLQASLYTLANITVRAWFGYRVAVAILGKLRDSPADPPSGIRMLARAILVGCVILTSR